MPKTRMTEAERVRAYRDRKRGGPPRQYHKRRRLPLLEDPHAEGQRLAWLDPAKRARMTAAIRAVWDDPLRIALMRKQAEKFERGPSGRFVRREVT